MNIQEQYDRRRPAVQDKVKEKKDVMMVECKEAL